MSAISDAVILTNFLVLALNERRFVLFLTKRGWLTLVTSGQVWGHAPEQRVAASTLRRYSFGLRRTIAKADARPAMPIFFR